MAFIDDMRAAGHAVEFIGRVQPQQVHDGLPLEYVRVDIEFVAGEFVHCSGAVGVAK